MCLQSSTGRSVSSATKQRIQLTLTFRTIWLSVTVQRSLQKMQARTSLIPSPQKIAWRCRLSRCNDTSTALTTSLSLV
eukprot:19864_5